MIRLHKALAPYINQLKTEPNESEVQEAVGANGGIPEAARPEGAK